jgi:hypothetical protein
VWGAPAPVAEAAVKRAAVDGGGKWAVLQEGRTRSARTLQEGRARGARTLQEGRARGARTLQEGRARGACKAEGKGPAAPAGAVQLGGVPPPVCVSGCGGPEKAREGVFTAVKWAHVLKMNEQGWPEPLYT